MLRLIALRFLRNRSLWLNEFVHAFLHLTAFSFIFITKAFKSTPPYLPLTLLKLSLLSSSNEEDDDDDDQEETIT